MACRALSEAAEKLPEVVGPSFSATLGTPGEVLLPELAQGDALSITVSNASGDLKRPDVLTALTLANTMLLGEHAVRFAIEGFVPGMVLHEGDMLDLLLRPESGFFGPFELTLVFETDQYADFGQSGQRFAYQLRGSVAAPPVPEPGTWALVAAGLAVVWRVRYRRSNAVQSAV